VTSWAVFLYTIQKILLYYLNNQLTRNPMQKITTHLWFDKEAKEAAEFYTSAFNEAFGNKKSKVKR